MTALMKLLYLILKQYAEQVNNKNSYDDCGKSNYNIVHIRSLISNINSAFILIQFSIISLWYFVFFTGK